jgi:hypothetical protein
MIRSRSSGSRPAACSAARAACRARSLLLTPSSAKCRARMPVRSVIQASLVCSPRRRQHAGHVVVGQAPRRQVAAGSGDAGVARGERTGRWRWVHAACSDAAPLAGVPAVWAALAGNRQSGRHPVQQPVARGIIRPHQGVFEGIGIGRAMALEDQAAQPQQGGTVVAPRIHPALEVLEHGHRHQRRQLGQRVACELLADELRQHRSQPFAGLEQHVADEAVADDHVHLTLEDVVALDIALEADQIGRRRPRAAVRRRA